jgi:hypothetical protein
MQPEPLFLNRCEKLAILIQSEKPIDLLDLAGVIKQLIADNHSLMDAVNNARIKIKFKVGTFREQPDQYTTLLSLHDGIDPDIPGYMGPSKHVTKDQFLSHQVAYVNGKPITILAGPIHQGSANSEV